MKKSSILLLLSFSLVSVCRGAADPKDLPFLRKLNSLYYCLSCEGLKGFTCSLRPDMQDWYSQKLIQKNHSDALMYAYTKTKVTLTDTVKVDDGAVTVDIVPPPMTGDPGLDP